MDKLELIFVSTGTRGDIAPIVAYAKRSAEDGYGVTLLSNADHSNLAGHYSIPFVSISDPDWPQVNRNEPAFFTQVVLPGYYSVHEYVIEALAIGKKLEIYARTGSWGAQFVAERYGIPFTRIALQPCAIRVNGHPTDSLQMDSLNKFREYLGLSPLDITKSIPEKWERTISLFPSWFGEPQSLWPQSGEVVDFQYLDDVDYKPDPELLSFLGDYKPVVISLGTGIQEANIFWRAAEMLASHGLPILFLSPNAVSPIHKEFPLLVKRNFADHKYILQRSSIFIHNGGIGAIAQAIRAKIPQVIFPLMWDQPDNAARVQRHGLGVSLKIHEITSRRFLAVIKKLYDLRR